MSEWDVRSGDKADNLHSLLRSAGMEFVMRYDANLKKWSFSFRDSELLDYLVSGTVTLRTDGDVFISPDIDYRPDTHT